MAGKRNAGNKRPSMFEVAKLAGVSHQTVSRVINHSPDVSDATREKVQKAIDQLGYRPSNSARALASHRSRTIGLIAGGDGALRCRLLDMGLTPRTRVTLQKVAPMGDPIEIRVRGYELTLRIEEAEKIEVEGVSA